MQAMTLGAEVFANRPAMWEPVWGHWQAYGLVFWAAVRNGVFVNMLTGERGASVGGRTIDEYDVAVDVGLLAQSERLSYTFGAAFDFGFPGPFDGLTANTVCYWVCPQTVAGAMWGQGDGFSSTFCETGANVGVFYRGGGDFRGAFTEVAEANVFQHLLFTGDTSGLYYFKDGRQVGSYGVDVGGPFTSASNNGFYIGGQAAGSGGVNDYVMARWADFRVYNYRLSDAQILALYEPQTRWALYSEAEDFPWLDAAATGRVTRNTHTWPLGMNLGMHHWHNG